MKHLSTELAEHLAGEVTSLATCWKLKRRDGNVLGFTNHDRDILFDTVIYQASSGFSPSAIENSGSLSVDNLDIEGMITSAHITETDILAGLYDFAEIEIFQVNYNDLTQGRIFLKRGWLGEVSLYRHQFIAEVRGMTQRFSQTIGELYSPSCRASLGDARCKVNLAEHTVAGSVTSALSNQQFLDSGRTETSGLFTSGLLTFTSGANQGIRMEVKEYTHTASAGGKIVLALPLPYNIAVGSNYTLTKGCDKTAPTCTQRFDNILNYRGEPHVPGLDRMLETAGTRTG